MAITKGIMKKRKEHGFRNLQLSEKLFNEKNYYDWVVTVSFYSAIHFIEDKILPRNVNGVYCKTISEVKNAYNMNGRHAARERLVWMFCSSIAPQYKWLDDQSRYSRYITYKITPATAEKAIQYLKEIFKECYN